MFRPRGVNSLLGSPEVKIWLAPSSEVTTDTIVADILTNLQPSTTLTTVHFGHGDGSLSSEAFCELFGCIHQLEEIYITGDIAYNLISALQIPVNHPFGVHTLFPHLRFFFLEEINLEHGDKACKELEDLLMQRYEYGLEIERLGFFECLQLS